MPSREKLGWSKLDNAAKIFPSTREQSDTRVFRFSCELYEEIDPGILQKAVNRAIKNFPNYLSVLRKGAFWYYLEHRELVPVVEPEHGRICAAMDQDDQRKLLFQVTYFGRRINLEMYHVLSDGTGAMQFLSAIVTYYLNERCAGRLRQPAGLLQGEASLSQRAADSFQKYYQKNKKGKKKICAVKAYNLKGEKLAEDGLLAIEALLSVRELLEAAHRFHATLTVFLTAVFIEALHRDMDLRSRRYPVVLRVPVNLRQFFPSETTRNFFGMIEVRYDFSTRSGEFPDVVAEVSRAFTEELTADQLALRMNSLAALEHNPFVRIAPLPIKNFALRQARHVSDRGETAVLSNIGRVVMPEELTPYIHSFHVFASTKKLQLCVCSFEDRLQLGFTSSFVDTNIQREFVSILGEYGVKAQVFSNGFFSEDSPAKNRERDEGDAAL